MRIGDDIAQHVILVLRDYHVHDAVGENELWPIYRANIPVIAALSGRNADYAFAPLYPAWSGYRQTPNGDTVNNSLLK
jgi:hypothetical protein